MNKKIALIPIFLILYSFLVFYPNPGNFIVSVYRLFNPPINVEAVEILAIGFENKTPAEIQRFVLDEIDYEYDWKTYNMPWYFPTVEQIIEKGEGDCKSRFLIIASIFEIYDIPYELLFSITHIWLNYEKKEETKIEKRELALYSERDGFRVPETDWETSRRTFRKAAWELIPRDKKINLLAGPFFAFLLVILPVKK